MDEECRKWWFARYRCADSGAENILANRLAYGQLNRAIDYVFYIYNNELQRRYLPNVTRVDAVSPYGDDEEQYERMWTAVLRTDQDFFAGVRTVRDKSVEFYEISLVHFFQDDPTLEAFWNHEA